MFYQAVEGDDVHEDVDEPHRRQGLNIWDIRNVVSMILDICDIYGGIVTAIAYGSEVGWFGCRMIRVLLPRVPRDSVPT